ncbi:uncharacterized protein LOC111894906 [Lactuca sativa]|uniref:uncharacterized protein LOC111894906 n=1 Tax=Lactuca sativa TaxID=4236 RepID=UPI0022AF761B|nr:uncharacterized protein LOC111894906 [Lactuca sativa]
MGDVCVIVGMYWLSRFGDLIDYERKLVMVRYPSGGVLTIYDNGTRSGSTFGSAARARQCLPHGCVGYLAYMVDTRIDEKRSISIVDVHMVPDFPDMSGSNNASGSNSNSSSSFSLLNICRSVTFDGCNFNDWICNIRMDLRYEEKDYILDKELKEIKETKANAEEIAKYMSHEKDATKVSLPSKRASGKVRDCRLVDNNQDERWRVHHEPFAKDAKPLPPGFISVLLENNIPENVMLRSVYEGYSWRLKIKKYGDIYWFSEGWKQVVEDTQLGIGDILVFIFVHHSTFELSIYSPDRCEKELRTKIQVEHDVVDEEEEGEDDDCVDNGGRRHDGGDEDDSGGGDIEENPFFMKIISKAHKYYLRLPAEFVGLAGMNEERTIRMKNVDGKEWKMRLKLERSRKAKRYYLSSGWPDFRRDNELYEGDKCVFKLIKSEDMLYLAKVIKKKGKVPVTEAIRRPRGRPRRVEKMVADKGPATEVPKRKRGRPPRVKAEIESKDDSTKGVKRSRGRPFKRK